MFALDLKIVQSSLQILMKDVTPTIAKIFNVHLDKNVLKMAV